MAYLTNKAYVLYPVHEEITGEEFRITKSFYFARMRKMDYYTRTLFFKNTYYSEDNVTWLKYNSYIYFSLASNPGSIQELYYYGKHKLI